MKWIYFFIAVIYASPAFAQDDRARKLDIIFSGLYATGKFSGNVLIAENGTVLYQKSFGLADETSKRPIDLNSLFLLGSVSKQFTAFAIVLLKEQGKISYNDTLRYFFPELPYENITIRQLLTHTSGVPDYIGIMNSLWDKSKYASNSDMIQTLVRYHPPIQFLPGTKYEYSNTGYALLASIIEKVSGMSFAQFMDEKIFRPLGMHRTIIYTRRFKPREVTDYALGYVYDDSLHNFVLPDQSAKFKNLLWEDGVVGEDGVNSTVGDLLIWDQALYHNKLIAYDHMAEIFTPQKLDSGVSDYGFGWHVKSVNDYGRIAYHSGGWPGYMAYIERHLNHHKTIIILRNKFSPELKMPIDQIRAILYNQNNPAKTISIFSDLLSYSRIKMPHIN